MDSRQHMTIVERYSGAEIARLLEQRDAARAMLAALKAAVARVEIANGEGNPILSAWLPDAQTAIAQAEAAGITEKD